MNTTDDLMSLETVNELSTPYVATHEHYVYFLIDGGVVVYVGRSVRPDVRYAAHCVDGRVFDSVAAIKCASLEESMELEFMYTCKFCPKYNGKLEPIKSVTTKSTAFRNCGVRRPQINRALKAGRLQPIHDGKFGTWFLVSDILLECTR